MTDEAPKPETKAAEPKTDVGPKAGTEITGFDMNKATIISLLYIAGFVVGVTGLVGFILALVWKDEVAGTWEESHLQYHVMTFIIGLVAGIVGFLLLIVGIGFLIWLALALWVLVRSVMALLKAQKQEPIPDPKTWLF